MQVAILSDTHNLLRPNVLEALSGVDHILHVGDFCREEVLHSLEKIAAVTAVRGNNDKGDWAQSLPVTQAIELGGKWFYMVHILEEIDIDPAAADMDIVLFGHTHKPADYQKDGVRYINPGSVGPRRFSLPITLLRGTVSEGLVDLNLLTFPS